jgi:hypothetical protein
MEKGEDVGGMLETAERVMRHFSVLSTRFRCLFHGYPEGDHCSRRLNRSIRVASC